MTIPAYVISIERNRPRCTRLIARLSEHGIEAQPWWGVDGAKPIRLQKGEAVDATSRISQARHGHKLNPTTIGCFLSHYRLYKYALEQRREHLLVFEDDAEPLPGLSGIVSELASSETQFEYVSLAPARITESVLRSRETDNLLPGNQNHLVREYHDVPGAVAYFITLNGIRELVNGLMPIADHLDPSIAAVLLKSRSRIFTLFPPAATTTPAGTNLIVHPTGGLWRRAVRVINRRRYRRLREEYLEERNELSEAAYRDSATQRNTRTAKSSL